MGEGAEKREWRETASVVNSRTWDHFFPHNGDFFEVYRWLRFVRRVSLFWFTRRPNRSDRRACKQPSDQPAAAVHQTRVSKLVPSLGIEISRRDILSESVSLNRPAFR
jgi:hypothetical protein